MEQTWGLTKMGERPSSKPPSRNQDYSNQIHAGNRLRQQGWRAFYDFDASSSRAVYLVTGSTPGLRWNRLLITTGRQDGGTHLRPRLYVDALTASWFPGRDDVAREPVGGEWERLGWGVCGRPSA